jgi:hypothetical protein
MKKLTIAFMASVLSSSVAFSTPNIKLEGLFDFNTAMRSQSKSERKGLSAHNSSVVFNTSANVTAKIEDKSDDLTYGTKIVMITTTAPKKSPGYNGSHIYVENENFGKIEVGAPFDVLTTMSITGNSESVATGGDSWNGILNDNPQDLYGVEYNGGDFYLSNFTSKNMSAVDREPSRKANYYTPKMEGFQFGVTWIPDSTNGGADKKTESSSYSDREVSYIAADQSIKKYNIRRGAKNAFALGATYEAEIAEATSIKFSLTGEFGKALQEAFIKSGNKYDRDEYVIDPNAVAADGETLKGDNKIKDLRSYNIGAQLTHGSFIYGVSYANLCKSFTSEALDKDNKDTDFYSAAVTYKQGPIGVSVTYLGGTNKKNKYDSIALGSEYKIAPGLITYAEVSYAKGKGKGGVFEAGKPAAGTTPAVAATYTKKDGKFSGTAFVLGLKVKV